MAERIIIKVVDDELDAVISKMDAITKRVKGMFGVGLEATAISLGLQAVNVWSEGFEQQRQAELAYKRMLRKYRGYG